MSTIEAQVTAALAKLGAQHLPDSGAETPRHATNDSPAYARPAQRRAAATVTLSHYASAPDRKAVPAGARDLEGRYATALLNGASVRVYVHTVEKRSTGIKAYVMRRDTRQRCYVLLELLSNVSDTE